jgi:hypothetical protein
LWQRNTSDVNADTIFLFVEVILGIRGKALLPEKHLWQLAGRESNRRFRIEGGASGYGVLHLYVI